jgi:hypothetical protein
MLHFNCRPLKWPEFPRSHKPFLGDLADGDAPASAAPILDEVLLPERLIHLFRRGARDDSFPRRRRRGQAPRAIEKLKRQENQLFFP